LDPVHRNGYRRPPLRCSITSPSTTAPHPPGYKGGKVYENNTGVLPNGEYREYDLHAKVKAAPGEKGVPRNQQRLLIDRHSGSVFLTDSHYKQGFRRVR